MVHGTTLVINALIERKGAATALITTRGFRDVLEMRNELRYDVYDLQLEFPQPLVPRALRFEIAERTLADGRVIAMPGESALRDIVIAMRHAEVKSVAVCLLHSYANPENERRIGRMLAMLAPELSVSLSCDVLPQIKEYERASTTAANAYVRPLIHTYLDRIATQLAGRGFPGQMFIMQSSGGVVSTATAQSCPIRILESGPAGGVAAGRWWGALCGAANLLCFDMGGTTAKLCTVIDGEALVADDYEVARVHHFKRGSGLAISVPVYDLLEIGTGGGSIARIDHLGLLKVGPQSAGAVPGPASYALGGEEATVTDADVVLGLLNPGYFLGGGMRLELPRALRAIEAKVARPLAMGNVEAAFGIHDISNEDMASAARLHLAERGEDAGRLTLVAYGGAGPVHAFGLAQKLGIARILVPPAAGVMSALGMLVADMAIDRVRTFKAAVTEVDQTELERRFLEMQTEAAALLQSGSLAMIVQRSADMRYRGQGYNIRVELPSGKASSRLDSAELARAFEAEYVKRYGRVYADVSIELVNLRLTARIRPRRPYVPPELLGATGKVLEASKGTRRAYFGSRAGYVECPVFDRYRLRAGHRFVGAALVEERETTTVVGPNGAFEVDRFGVLRVDVGSA
jgi:N-methylhydantoinase A